jgi:colicin import membrane protein
MKRLALLSIAAVCLGASLLAGGVHAQSDASDDSLKAASERMRQTGQQLQKDIHERLEKLRRERATLQARQAEERDEEAARERQQADKDKAALAAVKEARQRDALAAAQEKARKEAAARAAEAERLRQAALKEKEDQEAALERAQQESLDAYKAGAKERTLGSDTQFGVDL